MFCPLIYPKIKNLNDGGYGYMETPTPMTWDGNTEGKEAFWMDEEYGLVKITDDVLDLAKITSITIKQDFTGNGGEVREQTITNLIVEEEAGIGLLIDGEDGDSSYIVTQAPDIEEAMLPSSGTFLLYVKNGVVITHVSKVNFADTIHPIDPKYLPDLVSRLEALEAKVAELEGTT